MKIVRREFLRLSAAAAAVPATSRLGFADSYPTRPVRIIVGFPPGGITDITARLIAPVLSERFGQQFIVENRAGASSNLGTEAVVRAAPDGYTLLLAAATNSYNVTLYDKLNFDFLRDIVPVASIGRDAFVMATNMAFAPQTVPAFIAYAKANPGKINMATSGAGSSSDLYGELFKAVAGVDLFAVHYRGVGPALPDLISGRVEVIFLPVASAVGYLKAGKLRALGVTTLKRIEALPDVPAIAEFVPGYEGSGWEGLGAPVNTPPDVIAILNKQVNAILADPTFKTRLIELGSEPFASSPEEFGRYIADYTAKWAKVIRDAHIKGE